MGKTERTGRRCRQVDSSGISQLLIDQEDKCIFIYSLLVKSK